jgi:hypothetical protein
MIAANGLQIPIFCASMRTYDEYACASMLEESALDPLQKSFRRVGCEASSARRTVSVLDVRADSSTETTKQAAAEPAFATGPVSLRDPQIMTGF